MFGLAVIVFKDDCIPSCCRKGYYQDLSGSSRLRISLSFDQRRRSLDTLGNAPVE